MRDGPAALGDRTGSGKRVDRLFDLDDPRSPGLGKDGRPYFPAHAIDLTHDEYVTLSMDFRAERAAHRWAVSLDYNDKRGSAHIFVRGMAARSLSSAPVLSTWTVCP
ncbi:hypothetical protein ABZ801_21360 [Actinomadura sp. NPDC047616]|uniref:hypothetical protein n=1 Tax=Actinomadura sp. NPDC047616 TaxID=3155914 RepID=UPI0033C14EA4